MALASWPWAGTAEASCVPLVTSMWSWSTVGASRWPAIADAVWYPVWDEGIRLDHSVRQPDEVMRVAAGDLRALLGLLDGRVVAGDRSIVDPLKGQALKAWQANADRLAARARPAGDRAP